MTVFMYNGLEINSEDVTVDDMPNEVFREIYEFCGVDCALSLLINMNACLIQVPTKGLCNIEKKLVVKDYNGTTASIRNIARKYNISETYIRNILKENKITTPATGQLDLFDDNIASQ